VRRPLRPLVAAGACLAGGVLVLAGFVSGAPVPDVAPVRFERWPAPGLEFVTDPGRTEKRHQPETMVAGVALLDYDGDGWLDVFLVNGAELPSLDKTSPRYWNRLYRNRHDGSFEDVTEKAGVRGMGYDFGVAVGDYDADGRPDLLVLGLRRNVLYRNRGDGTFTDVTEAAGLLRKDPEYGTLWAVAGAFLDYDRDGALDIFVSNYCVWDPASEPACGPPGRRDYCHPKNYRGLPNSLFRNRGDGSFEDVSQRSGIRSHVGKGMGIGLADFDGDGFLDLFVANDTLPNFLFHNQGDGRFQEIGFDAGVGYVDTAQPLSGMGADAQDVDDDGLPDIFMTALASETMPLFRNTGANVFLDVTARSGVASLSAPRAGWSCGIVDLDNDGFRDLFVAGGDVMDVNGTFAAQVSQTNAVFVNLGNGRFADGTSAAGTEFSGKKAVHRGAAFGDLDNDGRTDAVVTDLHGEVEVWRNVSPTPNYWLTLALVGSAKSHPDAVGAKVRLLAGGRPRYGHVNSAVGYGSASDRRLHFGLGAEPVANEIQITWPSGTRQTLRDVRADQVLEVREPRP
jgi:enediyne biosynthesis protein E4